jgi:hypothetical protein
VIDANVIFDFAAGDLLDGLFRLPWELCAPDLLLATEILRPPAPRLVALGLVVHTLSGEQLVEIVTLRQARPALSLVDAAGFVLARHLGVGLLTGDRRLRGLAETSGIEVHGTLWLIDELVERCIIPEAQAAAGLKTMLAAGSHLPHDEVQARLRRWERS